MGKKINTLQAFQYFNSIPFFCNNVTSGNLIQQAFQYRDVLIFHPQFYFLKLGEKSNIFIMQNKTN